MWNTELWGKRYKTSGRIGRLDYLKSQLFIFAISMGLFMLTLLTTSAVLICISGIYVCIYLWLSVCLILKRLHDLGLSGWVLLGLFVLLFRVTISIGSDVHVYSLFGLIFGYTAGYVQLAIFIAFLTVLFCVKGTTTDNKYGKSLRS